MLLVGSRIKSGSEFQTIGPATIRYCPWCTGQDGVIVIHARVNDRCVIYGRKDRECTKRHEFTPRITRVRLR